MKDELTSAFERAIWYKTQFGPHGEVPKGQEEEYRRMLHEEIALGTFIASAIDVLTRDVPPDPRKDYFRQVAPGIDQGEMVSVRVPTPPSQEGPKAPGNNQ